MQRQPLATILAGTKATTIELDGKYPVLCIQECGARSTSSGKNRSPRVVPSRLDGQVQSMGGFGRHVVNYKIGMWCDGTLKKAMNAMTKDGMKLKMASKVYRIPTSLLETTYTGKKELGKEVTNQL